MSVLFLKDLPLIKPAEVLNPTSALTNIFVKVVVKLKPIRDLQLSRLKESRFRENHSLILRQDIQSLNPAKSSLILPTGILEE